MNTYYKQFLKPCRSRVEPSLFVDMIRNEVHLGISFHKLSNKLLKLSYKDFMGTYYWRMVSSYVRHIRGRCETCGSPKDLHAHHMSYGIVGLEIYHMDLLKVLCSKCHRYEHRYNKELKSSTKGQCIATGNRVVKCDLNGIEYSDKIKYRTRKELATICDNSKVKINLNNLSYKDYHFIVKNINEYKLNNIDHKLLIETLSLYK